MEHEDTTPHKENSRGRWLTVKELADRYGVTETCIWLWVKSGRLPPPHKLGLQTRRWPPEEIAEFEAGSRVGAKK